MFKSVGYFSERRLQSSRMNCAFSASISAFCASKSGDCVSSAAIFASNFLIVVSVGLETLRQINSRALMVTYDDYK